MKNQLKESHKTGNLLDHRRVTTRDHYSWGAGDANMERWAEFLEAAMAEHLAGGTRRRVT